MATTVHLPPELDRRVDERAKRLKVSRNQYVRRALERMIEKETAWSSRSLATWPSPPMPWRSRPRW
jgi:predicted transcriptional regulator